MRDNIADEMAMGENISFMMTASTKLKQLLDNEFNSFVKDQSDKEKAILKMSTLCIFVYAYALQEVEESQWETFLNGLITTVRTTMKIKAEDVKIQ